MSGSAATSRRESPSLLMRVAGSALGALAKRNEGRPLDLASARALNDRITRIIRDPRGVAVTDEVIAGVPVVRYSSGGGQGTFLFFHGGAYVMGAARQAATVAGISRYGGPDVVSVEYRLAPEHPFPAAVDDALAVYRELVEQVGAHRIVVGGESAGGGLALLLLQRIRAEALPMPAAVVPAFPWADLALAGESSNTNRGRDMLVRSELIAAARLFAGAVPPEDPSVSPLYGSFEGFPPAYIAVGSHDLLLDDARRVTEAMRRDGVNVRFEELPGVIHGFTALPVRETRRHRRIVQDFVRDALGAHPKPAVGRGRARFAAMGYAIRAAKALPASLREQLLDRAVDGVVGDLPPFEDTLRLVEAAGGVPEGSLWQERLLAERPELRAVVTSDVTDDTDGRVRARLYLPPTEAEEATAALVWVHGGAFITGGLDQREAHWPALELAAAGIPVVSVDYRQALNGTHFPVPLDDVQSAWRWAVRNVERLGVRPEQLHLGGASAGACLAAGASLRLRDSGEMLPASVYLAYPVLQGTLPAPIREAEAALSAPGLPPDAWIEGMFANWAGDASWDNPYVAPGLAELAGLPQTYVLTCGVDTLRRASEPYVDRLIAAGVPTWHDLFGESRHAVLDKPGEADGVQVIGRLQTWLRGGVDAMGGEA